MEIYQVRILVYLSNLDKEASIEHHDFGGYNELYLYEPLLLLRN